MASSDVVGDLHRLEAEAIKGDKESVRLIMKWLLRRAEVARTDPCAFFEFAIREEHTRAPIKVAPHQRLGIEFVEAHDRAVLMWPVSHAKTFTMGGLSLHRLGSDHTRRGLIVSAAQDQAVKPLDMVKSYVADPAVQMVFPTLRQTLRQHEPWTQTEITIDRPPGIRDPSLRAVGYRSSTILGSRVSDIYIDDILTPENVATKESRDQLYRWVGQQVLSRAYGEVDPRVVVTNTARHPEDLAHKLRDVAKWPTLQMSAEGDIRIHNTDFDSPLIRPATDSIADERVRLVDHDPDPHGRVPLFPVRFTRKMLLEIKNGMLPEVWAQDWLQECRDDSTALCRKEYIDRCKAAFRERMPYVPNPRKWRGYGPNWFATPDSVYRPSENTYTGIDLGIGTERRHDESSWFTFEVLPSRHRLLLDVEIGRFELDTLVSKSVDKWRRYGSITRVETNGGQDFMRQSLTKYGAVDMPVRAHHTGREKHDAIHGVTSIFAELMNGAWLIPCDEFGQVHPAVERWIQACLNYSPHKHTRDVLMANWFASTQARKIGHGALPGVQVIDPFDDAGSVGMNIMAR